jgi:hypothetical protein
VIGRRVWESTVCPDCGRRCNLLVDGTIECHMRPDGRHECRPDALPMAHIGIGIDATETFCGQPVPTQRPAGPIGTVRICERCRLALEREERPSPAP